MNFVWEKMGLYKHIFRYYRDSEFSVLLVHNFQMNYTHMSVIWSKTCISVKNALQNNKENKVTDIYSKVLYY